MFFLRKTLSLISNKSINVLKIHVSDEARFHLNGHVNKQNCRHWATENPHLVHATPLHSPSVIVWCAINGNGIIGPIFVDSTVTSEVYLHDIVEPFIEKCCGTNMIDGYWFQQDGARPHRTREVFDTLSEWFGDHIIGLDAPRLTGGGIDWPPNSPDLNPCDYWLWGYLKSIVYTGRPQTINDLKKAISDAINAIPIDMVQRSMLHFTTRLQKVVEMKGGHFENILH